MKILLLMRHAKAVPGDPGMADRDRPLAPRGHRDAALIGTSLAAEPPDAVLCSPAKRTRETLDGVLSQFRNKPDVAFVEALYAAPDGYAETIAESGSEAARLLVVGHNPAVHVTALLFAGSGERKLRARLAAKFPTGALATIAFAADRWSEIRPGSGRLTAVILPRDLGEDDGSD